MKLDAGTFLLQWATGGLFFGWVTTRRREVSLGYGWLIRITYTCMALLALALARLLVGAAFLGSVSDAMLLGHWYLVQPGLPRAAVKELVLWTAAVWPFEVAVFLWPTGMVQVLNGVIDDGYNGLLGWIWVA